MAWPWPVDCEPISKVRPPSRSSVSAAVSGPLLPQASIYVAMPMPRSRPARLDCDDRLLKPVPVRKLLRTRERPYKVAGIVNLPGRSLVRQRFRLDKISAPYRIGRDSEIVRCRVNNAFDQIGRLRPAGTAIGVDWNSVGVSRAQSYVRNGNIVGPGRHADAEPWDVGCVARQIGAHVSDDVEFERDETSLLVDCQPCSGNIVAPMTIAEKMLGALADPFDGSAQPFSRNGGQRIFTIGK